MWELGRTCLWPAIYFSLKKKGPSDVHTTFFHLYTAHRRLQGWRVANLKTWWRSRQKTHAGLFFKSKLSQIAGPRSITCYALKLMLPHHITERQLSLYTSISLSLWTQRMSYEQHEVFRPPSCLIRLSKWTIYRRRFLTTTRDSAQARVLSPLATWLTHGQSRSWRPAQCFHLCRGLCHQSSSAIRSQRHA